MTHVSLLPCLFWILQEPFMKAKEDEMKVLRAVGLYDHFKTLKLLLYTVPNFSDKTLHRLHCKE